MKQQMKAVWAILMMVTIWLTINSSKINNQATEQEEIDRVVQRMVAELEQRDREEESTSFDDAFSKARAEYGSGDVFEWNGKYYTTDYKQEEVIENKGYSHVGGWVLNPNDTDDWCATNDRDECGICGGSGKLVWYADNDGDGLGNANVVKLSCEEPTAFNQ